MTLVPTSSSSSSSSDAPPLYKIRSGSYTGPTFGGAVTSAGGIGGMGFAYSSCYVVPAAATKDRIGLLVTGAAPASTIRLGIYSDNGDMRPGALLLDAGPIDSTSTGLKQITIAQALAAGIYWLVALPLGASPTFQALYSDNASNAGSVIPLPGPATQLQSAAPFGGYVDNGSNVALPNPFPLPTYFQAGPMIVLRDV